MAPAGTKRRFVANKPNLQPRSQSSTVALRRIIAITIPFLLLLILYAASSLLSSQFYIPSSSAAVLTSLLTDPSSLYVISPLSPAVSTRTLSTRVKLPAQTKPLSSSQPCKYAAVILFPDLQNVQTLEDPPSIFPPMLNQSICIFTYSSTPLPDFESWQHLKSSFSASLISYTPSTIQSLISRYRTVKHAHSQIAIRNILYFEAIRSGSLAIFDIPPDHQPRHISFLHSFLTQMSDSSVTAAPLNLSSTNPSSLPFVNPLGALDPVHLSSLTKHLLSPNLRPLGMGPVHFAQTSSPLLTANLTLGILATAVDGYPDDIESSLHPIVFNQDAIKELQVALPAGSLAPFGSSGVIWGPGAFSLMYAAASGSLTNKFADLIRSVIATRILQALSADDKEGSKHIGFGPALTSKGLTQNWEDEVENRGLQDAALTSAVSRIGNWMMTEWPVDRSKSKKKSNAKKITVADMIVSAWEALRVQGIVSIDDVMLAVDFIHDLSSVASCELTDLCKLVVPNVKPLSFSDSLSTNSGSYQIDRKAASKSRSGELRKPNVAVCVSGQLRSLTMKPGDPHHKGWYQVFSSLPTPNESVAESIQRVVYPKLGGSPDVFMVVSTKEGPHEPKVDDLNACDPLRSPKGSMICKVRRETPVDIYRNDTLWASFAQVKLNEQNKDKVIQGLMQQLKGMYECHEEIQHHAGRYGKRYDWIVRLRPDMYFHKFPSLQQLSADNENGRIAWYASRNTCCCGNEDTFGIGPANVMEHYLDRYVHLQQKRWWFEESLTWSGESFTQLFLEGKGMRLEQHPDIQSCIVKPTRRLGSSEP